MNKTLKRINILLFYLLLFVAFVAILYFIFKPEMNCADGVKNQGEEQVDCGGPCTPCEEALDVDDLIIKSIERVGDGNGQEDVVIKVYNPNGEYGAALFKFNIFTSSNEKGYNYESFILPEETKYIIINNFIANDKNDTLNVRINKADIKWEKMIDYKDPSLVVYNNDYQVGSSRLTGVLNNKGDVDYETIKVKGVLRDANGKLLSASHQIINTLPAGTRREYHIVFPESVLQIAARKEIQVETNIFNSENYLKTRRRISPLDQ